MTPPKKNNPKDVLDLFREIKRLTNEAVRLKQEIAQKGAGQEIIIEELTLGSAQYPKTPGKVVVSGIPCLLKSATELKIIEPKAFNSMVRMEEDKLLKTQASWRTMPIINFFTRGREKLLAQLRQTSEYQETPFHVRPYIVDKAYLTDQFGVLAKGNVMRLCGLDKLKLMKRYIEVNNKISDLGNNQFYYALNRYSQARGDSVSTIKIESDYSYVEDLGVPDPFYYLPVGGFYVVNFEKLQNELTRLDNYLNSAENQTRHSPTSHRNSAKPRER